VVAVAVPVGISATGSTRADRPVAPASDAPSTSPSPSDPASVDPTEVALTTHGAAAGAAPSIAYLRGRTVVTPEGGQQDLPADYDSIASYRGGWLAVERRDGTPYVVQLDPSGSVVTAEPGGDSIAVSADGLEVSWVEGRTLFLDTTNGHSETPTSVGLPSGSASPVGFLAPGTVVLRIDGTKPRFGITSFSSPPQMMRGLIGLRAVNQERALLGAQTSADDGDGRSCWAVSTNQAGDKEPTTCEWTIESFNADGSHFAGYPSDTDGIGSSAVALVDARTAEVVARFERPGNSDAFVGDVAWEDDSHVLATLFEDGSWHLVRLGLDGSVETVDRVDGSPEDSPLHFAATTVVIGMLESAGRSSAEG
jgi:hypothetical protein